MFRRKRTRAGRTVRLQSGGSITLGYSFDLFELSPSDREFVNGLIDTLRDYQVTRDAARKAAGTGGPAATTGSGAVRIDATGPTPARSPTRSRSRAKAPAPSQTEPARTDA